MASPNPVPVFEQGTVLTPQLLTELSLVNYGSMGGDLRTWFESQVDRALAELGRAGLDFNSVYVSNLGKPGWPTEDDCDFQRKSDGQFVVPFPCLEVMALTELLDDRLRESLDLRTAVARRLEVVQLSQEQKGVNTRAFLELYVLLAGKLVELGGVATKSDQP